jgi:hypothetical protein
MPLCDREPKYSPEKMLNVRLGLRSNPILATDRVEQGLNCASFGIVHHQIGTARFEVTVPHLPIASNSAWSPLGFDVREVDPLYEVAQPDCDVEGRCLVDWFKKSRSQKLDAATSLVQRIYWSEPPRSLHGPDRVALAYSLPVSKTPEPVVTSNGPL